MTDSQRSWRQRLTYDYGRHGGYFVTLCTRNLECLFGQVVDNEVVLNQFGRIVRDELEIKPIMRHDVLVDESVVMPNHVHAIIAVIDPAEGTSPERIDPYGFTRKAPQSIGSLVAGLKSVITRYINEMRDSPGAPLWQPKYREHVIKSEEDLNRIRQHILDSPHRWPDDEYNPTNTAKNPGIS